MKNRKFKNYILYTLLLLLPILLTACGKNTRNEFMNALYFSNNKKFNSATFDVTIKDFDMKNTTMMDPAYSSILTDQVKKLKLEGDYYSNPKENTFELSMQMNILGQSLPIQLIGNKNEAYLSTNIISALFESAKSFGFVNSQKEDWKKLEGTYLNITADSESIVTNQASKHSNPLKEFIPSKDNTVTLLSELKKTLETFDEKSFQKEGDILSHTFTKKEILALMNTAKKTAEKENLTDYSNKLHQLIDLIDKEYNVFSIKTAVNGKTTAINCEFITEAVSETTAKNQINLRAELSIQPQQSDQEIVFPKENDILSQQQLSELLDELEASATMQIDPT